MHLQGHAAVGDYLLQEAPEAASIMDRYNQRPAELNNTSGGGI